MKKGPLLLIVGVVTLAFAGFFVWQGLEPNGSISHPVDESAKTSSGSVSKAPGTPTIVAEPARNEGAFRTDGDIAPPSSEKPPYQLAETTTSSFDPVADAKRREDLPFRMFASGGEGQIVDAAGNVIAKSDSTNAIFGCEVSPDQKRILIYRGSAKYDVVTPSTGETIRLPRQPPGENMLGFGSWHWVDDQMMVGVSGKTIPFRDDQVGTEREEPIISRSVLYVYDLKERKLSEVELPPALQTKTVSISAVDATGKVQLRPEGRELSYTDASLGWFEVRPKN
jgi:hypothetical protein